MHTYIYRRRKEKTHPPGSVKSHQHQHLSIQTIDWFSPGAMISGPLARSLSTTTPKHPLIGTRREDSDSVASRRIAVATLTANVTHTKEDELMLSDNASVCMHTSSVRLVSK